MSNGLRKPEEFAFYAGGVLMLIGAATYVFGGWLSNVAFVAGVLLFAAMQLRMGGFDENFVVRRLRRQQLFGAGMLVLSAVAMTAQTFFRHNFVQYNEWVILLLIGAVLQLYTAFRIPQAMKSWVMLVSFTPVLMLSSCADKYMVDGSTTVHGMEGKMLYLKVYDSENLKNMDSCYVTHGKFSFKGNVDSVVMANLFLGEQSLMPVVIEGDEVVLKIDEMSQVVMGSPMNDTLYNFIQRKTQIDNQLAELPRKEGRMVMDGMEHEEVMARLAAEERRLNLEGDQLVTGFIKRNYSNVLGPGIFMIMTSGYAYPVLTPQIEELLVGAPSYFLNHPYVKEYIRVAKENMDKLQQQ